MERFENLSVLNEKLEQLLIEFNRPNVSEIHKIGEVTWNNELMQAVESSKIRLQQLLLDVDRLSVYCRNFSEVEWQFLYNESSHLFSIGYNVQDHRLDAGYYDLLASEARLATFVGIAQHKLSEKSWFALGRLLTNVDGN